MALAHSSDWLNAIPIPGLGLKLDNASFRIVCGLRLALPLCKPYTCRCGELMDEYGRHGLSCRQVRGTIARHSQVNDLVSRAMGTALVPNRRELRGSVRGDMRRPDGIILVPWSRGKNLVCDFT